MTTNLARIQCLLQPDPYAKVRTLATHNRRTLSAMAAELIDTALKLPQYQEQLEEAEIQVPVRPDPRGAIRQVQLKAGPEALLKKGEREGGSYMDLVDEAEDKKAQLKELLLELLKS